MARRPTKRIRVGSNVHMDRIPLEDDFEVVQARTSSLRGPGHLPTDSARWPMKGHTSWTVGDTWAPEDDLELALDPHDGWFDEEMEADIGEVMDMPTVDVNRKQRRKKSHISVTTLSF